MNLAEFADKVHARMLLGKPAASAEEDQQCQEQAYAGFLKQSAGHFEAFLEHAGQTLQLQLHANS